MANNERISSPEIHCVFVETNLDTRLTLPVQKDEIIFDFREKLCKLHKEFFPKIGEISVLALKVKRRGEIFHLTDYVNVFTVFAGINKTWYMYVDAVRVEKYELLRLMAADQNLELVERKEDVSIDSVLVDENTKNLFLEEGLETEVAEKKSRKRKLKSSDVETSRKKPSIALNQSAVASGYCVVTTKERGDDVLMGAIEKDIVSEEKNDISMEENQQTSDADRQWQEKILTVNSELVEENTSSKVQDVPDNQNLKEVLETELAMRESNGSDESHESCGKVAVEKLDLRGTTEQGLENGGKTAELVKRDQEKDTAPTLELVITSRVDVNESNVVCGDIQVGVVSMISPIGKDSEGGEASVAQNLQTDEVVTYSENQMEASSGLTTGPATEKKRKRTKSSKNQIKSTAAATTTSRKIVDEINEVPGDVDCVGATLKSCPISKTPESPIVEAIQKETEMAVDTVEDVGKNNMVTNSLQPENHLEANNGLRTTPVTEKKKTRKKSSKAATSISTATTTTTVSRETVNEINGVPGNVDRVDSTSESCPISRKGNLGKEVEMAEKINEDVGSGKAIPSSADDIQTDNLVSYQENQLVVSSGLTTGPAKEKKKRVKKSSKNHINQNTDTTASKDVLNEREKVSGSIDHVVDSLADIMQNGNEMSDKFVDKVESIGEDKIQAANNLQVAGLVNTPHVLVQESKTLDRIGKFMEENTSHEHEVSKEKVEIDADQAKSVKSTKKKSSRKAKTPAKEDTPVDSAAQKVEPIKVVDGEGPDNVIRNVLDSLQQRNETEEILDKSKKKSRKRSKKTDSLNIVEAQVLDSLQQKNETEENLKEIGKKSSKRSKKKNSSITVEPQESSVEVKNAAKETPPVNNPKVPDAVVADKPEDNNPSKQIIKENADMGDNFGSIKNENIVSGGDKQDQVTGGAKSKEEKKSLDLHPSGSIDGSVKAKEKKRRVQPASSGTTHLQSKTKNDRGETKIDNSGESVKGPVKNRKEAVKKSSKSATVTKSKINVNTTNDAVKKSSNTVTMNMSTMNFFKYAENWNSEEEESKTTSYVSAKTPSDISSDDDSDVTSMSRKQGNNLVGGTNRISGNLQDILRSTKSYKKAKLIASQSQHDEFDDQSLALDFVPDSQAN